MIIFENWTNTRMKKLIVLFLFLGSFSGLFAQENNVKVEMGVYDPDTLAFEFYSQRTGLEIDRNANLSLYETVLDWVGVRYKYGGDSKRGVDCSGFCYAIYDQVFKTKLPSNSRSIFSETDEVDTENLKEGDFVFFKIRRSQVSHIGIYLGNDKFVHASVSRGVTISDLNEPYYKRYFYKAGRLKSAAMGKASGINAPSAGINQ